MKKVEQSLRKPKVMPSTVLFCPQPKHIQFAVIEELRNHKILKCKKLQSENLGFFLKCLLMAFHILWNWQHLHAQNIPVFDPVPKKTIFLLNWLMKMNNTLIFPIACSCTYTDYGKVEQLELLEPFCFFTLVVDWPSSFIRSITFLKKSALQHLCMISKKCGLFFSACISAPALQSTG